MSGPFGSSSFNHLVSTGFYNNVVNQSARFNDDDSAYLNRTITSASTGDGRKKSTFSCWIKQCKLNSSTTSHVLYNQGDDSGTNHYQIVLYQDDLYINDYDYGSSGSPGSDIILQTDRKFRDTTAWMNIIVRVDTTQSTAADRVRVYINGVQETSFSTATYPSENADLHIMGQTTNSTGVNTAATFIGRFTNTHKSDCYMADVNFCDGQSLGPSSFGESKDGIWIPVDTSDLTFGTNGFRLQFKETGTGTASASTIGADTSGQGNHFTSNNMAASDSNMPDCPENNWCIWNLISHDDEVPTTLANGNLVVTPPSSGGFEAAVASFTLPRTGKWYWEYRTGAGGGSIYGRPSIITVEEFYTQSNDRDEITGGSAATNPNGVLFTANDGGKRIGDSDTSFGSAVSANDIIGQAYNADTGQLYIYINNSIQASGVAISETIKSNFAGQDVFIMHERYNGNGADVYNFGQDSTFGGAVSAGGNADANGRGDFAYAPPSGYLSLCSANLTDTEIGPNVIEQSDDYFNTILYTADGNPSRSITGVGFQPDWLWIKSRNNTYYHGLWDSVRTNKSALYSNTADDEDTSTGATLGSLDADGFTTLNVSGGGFINIGTTTYVAWNWKMGTAFSNDASATSVGTIDSSGSISTKAGQAIISYTGTGSAGTIAHGLDSAPEFIIIKNLDDDSKNWNVHPTILGNSYLEFNRDIAKFTGSSYFNNTAPTNSVFSVGTAGSTNASGDDFIAYVFHSVDGYSKFGSYKGNGNANGVFLHFGFRPAWILIKQTGSGEDWEIWDSTRDPFNVLTLRLKGNTTGADVSSTFMDFVSNGVKFKNTSGGYNEDGSEYVYMAFAEAPFKYANAR